VKSGNALPPAPVVHLGSFDTSAVAGEVVELGSDEVLIPGLVDTHVQVSLAAVWTEASRRGFDLADVVRWMATNTADQVGLTDRGRIAVSAVADLVVFAPDEEFTVDVARLHHKNAVTAYDKLGVRGVVRRTWLASPGLLVRA
jgi:dihydroorotase-like cyclic amidohydrolase